MGTDINEAFGIFDTFNDEEGRAAHVNGEVAKALLSRAEELFVAPPQIQMVDVLSEKVRGTQASSAERH